MVLTLISRYHGKAQNPKQFSPSEPFEGHFHVFEKAIRIDI